MPSSSPSRTASSRSKRRSTGSPFGDPARVPQVGPRRTASRTSSCGTWRCSRRASARSATMDRDGESRRRASARSAEQAERRKKGRSTSRRSSPPRRWRGAIAGSAPVPPGPGARRAAGARERHARAEGALPRHLQRHERRSSGGAPTRSPSRARGATSPASGRAAARTAKHWVLNGRKCYITNGARASWNVVFATVDPALGRAGHRAFVVEKGTPGFSVGRIEDKMGLRASETAELVFEECRVPEENLLGGEERVRRHEGRLHDGHEDLRQHAPARRGDGGRASAARRTSTRATS